MPRRQRSPALLLILAASLLLIGGGRFAAAGDDTAGDERVSATSALPTYASLHERVLAFVDAFNSADENAMFTFYADGVTDAFAGKASRDADRALYRGLRADLGRIEIMGLMRERPEELVMVIRAEEKPGPMHFLFSVKDERIDGFALRPGEPGGGEELLDLGEFAGDASLAKRLQEQLEGLAAKDEFAGVVLIARDGTPVFHEAFGPANREKRRPNRIGTAFDVGSITKFLTRIAIAQLLQAGKLKLDGHIADYLPDYPDTQIAHQVTVRQLIDHSSGLGDIFNKRWQQADKTTMIAPRDFFPIFAGLPLLFEPGTSNAYSNAGYVVLGAIVEAVAGRPYAEYLGERIFAPAGMRNSWLAIRDGSNPGFAIGYTRTGPDAPLVSNLNMLPIAGCPAGSSMHTAEDLLKLDRALRAGKLLDPEWTAWVYHSAKPLDPYEYAIGIAGGAEGVSAGMESSGRLTVIVLSNLDRVGETLAMQIARHLRGT